jgi:hypothetical protein
LLNLLSLKTDVNAPTVSKKQKTADPDPYLNDTDSDTLLVYNVVICSSGVADLTVGRLRFSSLSVDGGSRSLRQLLPVSLLFVA